MGKEKGKEEIKEENREKGTWEKRKGSGKDLQRKGEGGNEGG